MADQQPVATHHNITIPDTSAVGVFADFASVWHTPNTFVIDFLSVKQPVTTGQHDGQPATIVDSTVAARVRLPPEQIFALIKALSDQSQRWLAESGRQEPPESWLPHV